MIKMHRIILKSSDSQTFPLDVEAAKQSNYLKDFIEEQELKSTFNENRGQGEGGEPLCRFKNIRGDVLKRVIEWMEKHKNDPAQPQPQQLPPVPNEEEEDVDVDEEEEEEENNADAEPIQPQSHNQIDQWDKDFLQADHNGIFELMMAANTLDIEGLLHIIFAYLADELKKKTPEDIRGKFNLPDDLSRDERRQIEMENKYCGEYRFPRWV